MSDSGKRFYWLLALCATALTGGRLAQQHSGVAASATAQMQDQRAAAHAQATYAKLPLRFEANQGQFAPAVKFLGRGAGVQVLLTAREAVMYSPSAKLRMRLAGANDAPQIEGRAPLPGVSNYFIGKDPAQWRTGVQTFNQVHYANVYDGVDLLYYGNAGQLEYDFVVAPHADAQQIAFDFAEATPTVEASGELVIRVGRGEVRWRKPVAYQERNGARHEVAAAFAIRHPHQDELAAIRNQVAFELGDYEHSLPLVIDPVLSYATYFGGSSQENGSSGMVLDGAGNIYLTGATNSVDFPISANAFQTFLCSGISACDGSFGGLTDVYVTKLSPGGGSLIYSTYLGGTGDDAGTALAVDASGNVFVTGTARLFNFPIVNAIEPNPHTSGDSFVAKLNATGSALIFSTYFGGNTPSGISSTVARGLAVDANGNAYVAGATNVSDLLVTPGAFQTSYMNAGTGSFDGFVAKFNPVGGVIYSTYLGGTGDDQIYDIAVDGAGNAYLTGLTRSGNFPTQTPIQPGLNGNSLSDAFVTKLNAAGSQLVYSTYLGGSGSEQGNGIAVDNTGSAYVTGFTRSPAPGGFPVVNAFQPNYGGDVTNFSIPSDVFVTRLNPAGTAYVYSTYLGGDFTDTGYDIAVDNAGNAYVTGITLSSNIPFPTRNAFQPNFNSIGFADAFVARLNTNLSGDASLIYSSYLGGNNTDTGYAIARDSAGRAYVYGDTRSSNFPTVNPLPGQSTLRGVSDAFLAVVTDVALIPNAQTIAIGSAGALAITISPAQAANITIPLSSSNPAIASVPPSVTINANATSAIFNATGLTNGTATITATLPASLGGGILTATVQVVPLEIALTSGQQQAGSILASDPGSGLLGVTQYTIAVPAGAQQLKVDLSGNTDVDLYVRFGQRITIQNGAAVADFRSESATGIESITITPASTPALQAGTYYIAVANFGPGASTFVVMATVMGGNCPAITVNPATLANGTVGAAYNQTLTATGGTAPYTFTLSGGALPTGMTLSNAGVLSGTPTAGGTFNFMVRATDLLGCLGTRAYALVVNPACGTILVNPASLPAGTVGAAYNQTISATGGAAAYSFAVIAGALPNGVTLNAASGVLSGTPSAPGMSNFTIRATDANGCQGTQSYTLTINCQTITVNPAAINNGTLNQAYSQTFTQTGGNGTTAFNVTGALPTGLSLNSTTGLLSGTPTQAGSFPITIRATDANGCMGTRAYTLNINNAACGTITVNPATLPNGTTGAAYSQTLTATGGTAAYSFTVMTGTLPAGLSLSTAGLLSGTPSAPGMVNVTIQAADANGCFGTRAYTLMIVCPTITVNPASVGPGTAGTAFSQTFTQTGGTGAITWSFVGTLPNGLSLNAATGVLAGTPSAAGTFNLWIVATDASTCTGNRLYTLTINCPTITVNPASLPNGRAGVAYNQTLTASSNGGGTAPYTFTVSAGALPAGLTLGAGGGLSGTPASFGNFNFTATATDANGCTGGRAYTLTINPPCPTLTVNPASLPNGFQSTAYSQTSTATGGTAPYTFAVTLGGLPLGLTLASNGALTGTPTAAGTFSFTVTATDNTGCTGLRAYTVIISANGLQFYALPAPVRLLETRVGLTGCTTPGVPINANGTLTLPARTTCAGIPAAAAAVTGNITVVPSGPGFLTLFPSSATQPTVANSNFGTGEITNNVFTVGLGASDGAFKIFSSATTHVIVDVTGYYAPPNTGGLYFHPLATPVRLLETRVGLTGCITPGAQLIGTGNPNADPNLDLLLQGRSPVAAPCNSIPATAQVLVGNATSVLPTGGGYLTIYPSGGTRPTVASSNYAGGDVINGPFAVKLGADGKFKIYTFATTHLVVDILGYYSEDAVDANGAGLLFNPLPSLVRLLETRAGLSGCTLTGAPIVGNLANATHTQMAANFCGLPAAAQAVVGNVSVVNTTGAGFLTLFPANLTTAPLVATSNYPAPATFGYNRHFFVGLSPADGKFKVLTQFTTDLILDASGYFAP